LKVYPTF